MRPTVALGLLGVSLDGSDGTAARWERWRPSVALCQHEDLLVDRFELLHQPKFSDLAEAVADDVRTVSPETDVRLHPLAFDDVWDFEEVFRTLHDFAVDYPFDPDAEDYLVHITTGSHVAQISLFLLVESRFFPARLIQTSPPRRSTASPAGAYRLIDLDLSKYDRLASRSEQTFWEDLNFLKSGIQTRNPAFNALIEQIERVAIYSRDPMLLTGPTGAGKSQLARRIYELKKTRRQVEGSFVEVNCATLRGDQAMAALFGHTKGAFTGAARARPGLLRTANSGVLFLDEIGELGLDEQAMLLRALEDKRFLPVGADAEAESDFQLIAGTNRALGEAVHAGDFREDLLARINLWTFQLPGLRERPEDIEPNLDYELSKAAQRLNRMVRFSTEARTQFLAFATSPSARWSANFRDLNAAVTRMATLAPGGRITEDVVADEIERLRVAWASPREGGVHHDVVVSEVLGDATSTLDRFDRVQLAEVIRVCRQLPTLSEAGRELFAESRKRRKTTNDADRLRKYLGRFDLSWESVQER